MTRKEMEDGALLDAEQAASYLALSVHTVRAWTRSGRLRVVRLGRSLRFRRQDLDVFIDDHASPRVDRNETPLPSASES